MRVFSFEILVKQTHICMDSIFTITTSIRYYFFLSPEDFENESESHLVVSGI